MKGKLFQNKIIALIPARQGSERIKNKNIAKISNHPLIAHTIIAAKRTDLFSNIVVSTNSIRYSKIAKKYGAEVPFLRPNNISTSHSADYEWVNFTIKKLKKMGFFFSHFFILRPTNPFRTSSTILRAWNQFKKHKNADSLRAVETCNQHPGKMWLKSKRFIKPFFPGKKHNQPYYNLQFKSLPKILVQNASLEISKVKVLSLYKSITGKKIIPFYTKGIEGFDINYQHDLKYAHFLAKKNKIKIKK
tara:strand:- start:51 stop:791 length:741 start_codon:yes stop_codon:yes gene_type:complete